MSLTIEGTLIERVQIVDDDPLAREGYSISVEDLDLTPVFADGPRYTDLQKFVEMVLNESQAAIFDYHLSASNFASFDGSAAVAQLYQKRFPAILCTRYYDAEIDNIRHNRLYIPVLIKPDDLEPETIKDGFQRCLEEFKGNFSPSRKLWRSLVRVDNVDKQRDYFHVVVPSWNSNKIIRLRLIDIPQNVRSRVLKGHIRFHADVNVGAEQYEDLYFTNWEQE